MSRVSALELTVVGALDLCHNVLDDQDAASTVEDVVGALKDMAQVCVLFILGCSPIADADLSQGLKAKEKDAADMALRFQNLSTRVKAYAETIKTRALLAQQQQKIVVESAIANLKNAEDRLKE
jgi:hypothetical protein